MQSQCDCAGWLGGEERARRYTSRGGRKEEGEGRDGREGREKGERREKGEMGEGRWERGKERASGKGEGTHNWVNILLAACLTDTNTPYNYQNLS